MASANISINDLPEGSKNPQHETPLAGKVALVIGGTRGVGAAVSMALAQAGADVAVTYSASEERAKEHVEALERTSGNRAAAIKHQPGDLKQADSLLRQVTKAFVRLDILVHTS